MTTIASAYENFCENRFPLPREEQLDELERQIDASFPDDYRQFILQYNGGFFNEPRIAPPDNECPLDRLTYLKGIGASHPCAELGTEADILLFDDNDPLEILPIGTTLMGNLLILVMRPDEKGSILLKVADSDDYHLLAEGIEEFFTLLQVPPS